MRFSALALTLLFAPIATFAQSSGDILDASSSSASSSVSSIAAGTATVTIEQTAIRGVNGSWILALPDQTQRTGNGDTETLVDVPSGNYVVYATLPSGMKSTIRIYRNDVLDQFYERQQTPLVIQPGENVRIAIHYHLDRTGIVSVKSDPSGTLFTLTGPDGLSYTGTTPAVYEDLPEGQYKVQYESFSDGCVKPAPKASQLVEDGRISFDIRFECDAATKARARLSKESAKYLTIIADGSEVQLRDVLQSDWFATYVFEAAKRNILSGYRTDAGVLTGTFGPGNNVTIAELSKIAHRMAGLSEEPFLNVAPRNASGANQWFSPFIASSENRGWVIYGNPVLDPTRPATRAEVVVTLLQAFDVGLRWQKGNVFHDVPVTHPYAAAIETAAQDGIIAGRSDEKGNNTGIFDPEAAITRAEIAKIITTMLTTYKSPTALRNAASRER